MPTDRAAAIRRNTILLAGAQALLLAAINAWVSIGVATVYDLTEREASAGLLSAVYFVAVAVAAPAAGRLMDRRGRRPGLAAGYAVLALGGLLSALAAWSGSVLAVLAATLPVGAGAGIALLGRGAVADMYEPERRGRAVGLVLGAGVVGGVIAPLLVAAARSVGERVLPGNPLVLPWLLVPLFAAPAVVVVASLRPDPRDLAWASLSQDGSLAPAPVSIVPSTQAARSPSLHRAPLRAAVVGLAVAQLAMVSLMTMGPTLVHAHGGSALAVSTVVSVHLAGMFGFAPLVGTLLDRAGRRVGLLAGSVVTVIGALVASMLSGLAMVATGLFLVGVGWSAAYLGATAVASDLTTPAERASLLGRIDLLAAVASIAGGLAGGVVLDLGGSAVLGVGVSVPFILVAVLVLRLHEPRPGRWETQPALP